MVSWTPHIFSKQLSNDGTSRPRYSDARCRPAQWRGRIAKVSSKEAERTAQKKHTRGTTHREPKLVMLAISAHRQGSKNAEPFANKTPSDRTECQSSDRKGSSKSRRLTYNSRRPFSAAFILRGDRHSLGDSGPSGLNFV